MVQLVLRDHKGRLDLKDLPEMMVQMDKMVQMAHQVLMVKMVLRDHKDRLEMMVRMDKMVSKGL